MATPTIKKYYLQYLNGSISESIELYLFPEDFNSSLDTRYAQLNKYGVYPYLNFRTHNVSVRYADRYTLNKLEYIAQHSIDSGVPLTFGSTLDYAARHNNNVPPPNPAISLVGNETTPQVIQLETTKQTELLDYEFDLDAQLKPFQGFIDLPIETKGLIGSGQSVEGFTFRITEVKEIYRQVMIGCLSMFIPPESYSYQEESVTQGEFYYGANNTIIKTPSYVRKGFSINLPSCYTDTYQTLQQYRSQSAIAGIDILDNVGNSFNGRGYLTSVTPNGGAINKKENDPNPSNFLPNGLSLSVLSLEVFQVT